MRRTITRERLRATLWFWPCVAAVGVFVVTLALLEVRPEEGSGWARWLWPDDRELALALVQTSATAVMAATTLTFSLTVVALQLASQQFSPRLLRAFARDRLTQATLALLVSTFVMAMTGLRGITPDLPLPALVLALVFVMTIASILALLAFLGHLAWSLRVDSMMLSVHQEAIEALETTYGDSADRTQGSAAWHPDAVVITAAKSGIVRVVHAARLVREVTRAGALVTVVAQPGDHIVRGAPLALVESESGGRPSKEAADRLCDLVREAVDVGFERTAEEDPALGLRQLTDIALRALSPGVTDPATAVHALGFCADILVRLQGREIGHREHRDSAGTVRVISMDRDYRYYLDLTCSSLRRHARSEPMALEGLLRLLRDCAIQARTDDQRIELERQLDLVLAEVDEGLLPADREAINGIGERVRAALRGDKRGAYADEAGETRSS